MQPPPCVIEDLWNEPLPRELCRDEAHFQSEANQQRREGRPPVGEGRASGGGAAPLGLSYNHKRPQPGITCYEGASGVEIETGRRGRRPFDFQSEQRGTIKSFTSRAARRMRWGMAKVRKSELVILVALTYPAEFPDDRQVYKRHFKLWLQRVRRKFPTVGGFWKLEFQPRLRQKKHNAAHFHLMLWGVPMDADRVGKPGRARNLHSYVDFMEWVSRSWYEVVGSGDEKHLRAGTSCEVARSFRGAMCYCSCYTSKQEQTLHNKEVGRYWGAFGRSNIPFGKAVQVATSQEQATAAARVARRFAQSVSRAAAVKRISEEREGKWRPHKFGSGGEWVKVPLRRRRHGPRKEEVKKLKPIPGLEWLEPKPVIRRPRTNKRLVNRLPKLRSPGNFCAIMDADFFKVRRVEICYGRPIHRLPKLLGFRPKLP